MDQRGYRPAVLAQKRHPARLRLDWELHWLAVNIDIARDPIPKRKLDSRIPERIGEHLLHRRGRQRPVASAHGDPPEADRREQIPPDLTEENCNRNRQCR